MKPDRAWVYGIYNRRGVCLYVGITGNPVYRERSHKLRFPRASMKLLALGEPNQCAAMETEFIAAFRALGQARHNRNKLPAVKTVLSPVVPHVRNGITFVRVRDVQTGKTYPTLIAVARFVAKDNSWPLWKAQNFVASNARFKRLPKRKRARA